MGSASENNPLLEPISKECSEQIKRYQDDIWGRDHFENAIKWDVGAIGKFLQTRCTRNGYKDESGSGIGQDGNGNGAEGMKFGDNDFLIQETLYQSKASVLKVICKEASCSEGSSIHSMSGKDDESPTSSTSSDDGFSNGRMDSGPDLQRSDLENLWNKAIKPYFSNWKKEHHGTVLVTPPFMVKIHGKDVEIFSIFCALAAVLNIAPLNTPGGPCPPFIGISVIQYQWLLTTLLGKWIITIAARFPTVFCVMSRQIGKKTIYVCGTTKPKVATALWPKKDRDSMTESRHALVDKAIGEHPLELRSLEFTHDENMIKQKLSSPLGVALEATEVKEITGHLDVLFQEICSFSKIYKEGELKRREEDRKDEEEDERRRKQMQSLPELEERRKREEEEREEERKILAEKIRLEKTERGASWREKWRDVIRGEKRKAKRRGESSSTVEPVLREAEILERRSRPDARPRREGPEEVVSMTGGKERRDMGQQRIGDCAEVWGLATLVGLQGPEDASGDSSTLLSVSIDAKTIRTIKLANCIDHICLKTAGSKPACEGCTYLFNVVRFKSGTKAVDNMYGDGKCRNRADSSGCTGADC